LHQQPAFAAPTNSKDVFPKLPQSKICDKNSVVGVWKLLMVYEVPSGKEIALYTERPLQYIVFDPESLYGEYISSLRIVSADDVRKTALAQKIIQQYTVSNSGIIFFYKNSVATDSLACFIAARNEGPFEIGQMLLMPPKKAAKGRMIKIYQKIQLEKEPESYSESTNENVDQ
jgi:hypothetical protein